jgi:phosphoenolpyruvate synthase/pyruvate phosphate dikinase
MEDALKVWPILAFMIAQTVAVTWWAATINGKVVQLEKDRDALSNHGERMVAIEAAMTHISGKLDELVTELGSWRKRT